MSKIVFKMFDMAFVLAFLFSKFRQTDSSCLFCMANKRTQRSSGQLTVDQS